VNNRKNTTRQSSFSRRFDRALVAVRITDAMVKADGWRLDQFVEAPPWLRELYNRHADAACREIKALEKDENALKPSEHD